MMLRLFTLVLSWYLVCGCSQLQKKDYGLPLYSQLDVQGHRGCRGNLPENSMAGFLQALEWGVTTLEMDVVISKDHQVVVSHEPYMSYKICLDGAGNNLDSASLFRYNIYEMTYQEIQEFDCGSITPDDFRSQKPVSGPKPLLKEVVLAVEMRRKELQLPPVKYNIETKCKLGYDGIFHPEPARFVDLVLAVLQEQNITQNTTIQSFDPRTLRQVREKNPEITTALLVANDQSPLQNFIELGFEPDIYSPKHNLVTDSLIHYLHEKNIAIVPWTVDDSTQMTRLIAMGVDGIITDYPKVLLNLVEHSVRQP